MNRVPTIGNHGKSGGGDAGADAMNRVPTFGKFG